MNKIVVGTAPSPQVSKVTSKIGSLSNASYKPQASNVKIENKKLEFGKSAKSRVGSLGNVSHVAGGGAVKVCDFYLPIFCTYANSQKYI